MPLPRTNLLLAAVCMLLMGGVSDADAHAFPSRADPAVGSTLPNAPPVVRIWFSEKLEASFSRIEVRDVQGRRVDLNDAKVDSADPTLIAVSLAPLAAGTYKVTWHVVSVDTHATEGDFSFSVGK